jgi:hypothetical protein
MRGRLVRYSDLDEEELTHQHARLKIPIYPTAKKP